MIIPEGVTKLESCAISDCNDIETIEIPSTVNYIDRAWADYGNSFCGCSKLRSINVNDNNNIIDELMPFDLDNVIKYDEEYLNDFHEDKLKENLVYVVNSISKLKPSAVKGTFVQNIAISTTMGPGIKVDKNSFHN